MSVVLVTGASGLIGSEAASFFAAKGFDVVGIDNDMRRYFFGDDGSTAWSRARLEAQVTRLPPRARRHSRRGRDDRLSARSYGRDIALVIHTAAQPSHDWAAREPLTDFTVNANGTLNLLEATRRHCAGRRPFIFTSTNKVYGDTPNRLPLVETETRWEVAEEHPYAVHGIDESMSIDQTMHSLFGASKVAADVMVQEYGRYFGMKTAVFRGGCLTGPGHSGAELHGFLAYLMKCAVTGAPYTVFGYKGKQVRDNIHSLRPRQRVLALHRRRRAAARSTTSAAGRLELLDARGHRHLRADHRPADGLVLPRRQPHRRPHLVDQRHSQVRLALSAAGR